MLSPLEKLMWLQHRALTGQIPDHIARELEPTRPPATTGYYLPATTAQVEAYDHRTERWRRIYPPIHLPEGAKIRVAGKAFEVYRGQLVDL